MYLTHDLARAIHADREREIRSRLSLVAGMSSGRRHPSIPEYEPEPEFEPEPRRRPGRPVSPLPQAAPAPATSASR